VVRQCTQEDRLRGIISFVEDNFTLATRGCVLKSTKSGSDAACAEQLLTVSAARMIVGKKRTVGGSVVRCAG
jgi:hypothetical protein